ncbi:MAG TPA: LON peptidase substrate-binding domain-containing protein [Stellaceae bacterium]|nr:LON peptidase substrate-binding domain-containing protein [Stellaceae bacterium]
MALEDRELRTSGSAPPPSPGSVDMGSAAVAALPEDALILIPTRNLVLFPGTVLPITLGRQRSVLAAQTAMRLNRTVGLVLQRDPGIDDPIPVDLHRMGTEASLLRYVTSPDGGHHAICQGERRFRILDFLDGYPFLAARVERIE